MSGDYISGMLYTEEQLPGPSMESSPIARLDGTQTSGNPSARRLIRHLTSSLRKNEIFSGKLSPVLGRVWKKNASSFGGLHKISSLLVKKSRNLGKIIRYHLR